MRQFPNSSLHSLLKNVRRCPSDPSVSHFMSSSRSEDQPFLRHHRDAETEQSLFSRSLSLMGKSSQEADASCLRLE